MKFLQKIFEAGNYRSDNKKQSKSIVEFLS